MYINSKWLSYRVRNNDYADDGFGNMLHLEHNSYWSAVDFDIDGRDTFH